jgi:hypothetical protein
MRRATLPAARQRPRPNAKIDGGEISWRFLLATLAGHFDRLYSHLDAHRLPSISTLLQHPLESYFFERVPEATIMSP